MKSTVRLHILLARDAPVGLVIRHGTAKSVCTLLWDRKRDQITLGQWMRGRIETGSCDLSPDGEHFLYSAAKCPRGDLIEWTVVSRTPYLKAVAYYPWRRGGGWFMNNQDYCVFSGSPDPKALEHPEVRRVESVLSQPSLCALRMVRGGWSIGKSRFNDEIEFERDLGRGWTLRHQEGAGYGEHPQYSLSREGLKADTRGWDWADVDGSRLVWTAKGCLYSGLLRTAGLDQVKLLHDFNGMKFEALAAPYEGGRPVVERKEPPEPAKRTTARAGKKWIKPHKKRNRAKVRPGDES